MILFKRLVIFVGLLTVTGASNWTSSLTSCIWNEYTESNRFNRRIDLRDIRSEILTFKSNGTTFYFNPCKTFNIPIDGDPHSVQGEQCHNVLGCKQIVRRNNSHYFYTVAIRLKSLVLPEAENLTIRYVGSKSFANRSFLVQLQCDRGIHRAQFNLIQYENNQNPVFSLTHRCCCPNVCGGNTFPKALLLTLLFVILFIIGTAVWIFFQCRRHYPERKTYGVIASGEIDINALEPNQVLKSNPADFHLRSGPTKRTRTRSIVPVLDNSIISVQDLKFVKRLGVGELGGEVNEGRWREKSVIIKTLRIGIHPDKFSNADKTYLENEIAILSRLRHKNLGALIGICFDIDVYPRLILSFAEHGTIIDFIQRFPNKVDWSLRISWCLNIAEAMNYLHQSNLLHRNLKSSNILIGVDLRAHVCDYGLMAVLQPLRQACDSERCLCKLSHSALPVSIRWSAPEILANPSDSTRFQYSCDVYSFGVCLWEQIRLEQPYAEITDEAEVCRMIVIGHRLSLAEDVIGHVLPEYQQLMIDCWNETPSERPTFDQIAATLRSILPKMKTILKSSMKRLPSVMTHNEFHDDQSLLWRIDSRISSETPKSPHPNL